MSIPDQYEIISLDVISLFTNVTQGSHLQRYRKTMAPTVQ